MAAEPAFRSATRPRPTNHRGRESPCDGGNQDSVLRRELLAEIAGGGMDVVWKARHVTLGRVVAVKMILAGQLAGPADVREAQALES